MGISVAFRFLVCSQTTRLSLDYYLDVHGLLLSRCFYNNAAKIFGTEGVLSRRFENFAIKRSFKQAEGVDYQRLPLGCVFLLFFSSCRRLCRKKLMLCHISICNSGIKFYYLLCFSIYLCNSVLFSL